MLPRMAVTGASVAQRIQNRRVADVAGVQDVLDAAQSFDCLRAEQTVGIGNNADHKPINSVVRGSR